MKKRLINELRPALWKQVKVLQSEDVNILIVTTAIDEARKCYLVQIIGEDVDLLSFADSILWRVFKYHWYKDK